MSYYALLLAIIIILHKNLQICILKLVFKATSFNLFSTFCTIFLKNYRQQTHWQHLHNIVNLSIDIRPRSSVWKTGMVLSNCEGTVDEGYTNEISAVFYHVMPNMPRYKVGDKIAQMKIGFTFPCDFKVVDELADTERGLKGYGSSGK